MGKTSGGHRENLGGVVRTMSLLRNLADGLRSLLGKERAGQELDFPPLLKAAECLDQITLIPVCICLAQVKEMIVVHAGQSLKLRLRAGA